jgi:hypothetical protein
MAGSCLSSHEGRDQFLDILGYLAAGLHAFLRASKLTKSHNRSVHGEGPAHLIPVKKQAHNYYYRNYWWKLIFKQQQVHHFTIPLITSQRCLLNPQDGNSRDLKVTKKLAMLEGHAHDKLG